jgi:hypothetical protein
MECVQKAGGGGTEHKTEILKVGLHNSLYVLFQRRFYLLHRSRLKVLVSARYFCITYSLLLEKTPELTAAGNVSLLNHEKKYHTLR